MTFIVLARKYINSIIIPIVGAIAHIQYHIILSFFVLAVAIETFTILPNYSLLDFTNTQVHSRLVKPVISRSHAFFVQLITATICALFPILVSTMMVIETWRQASAMLALLISGIVGSYCGFRVVRADVSAERLLAAHDVMPDMFTVFQALGPLGTRISAAIMRLLFGIAFISLFTYCAAIRFDREEYLISVFIMLVLSCFCQIGFVLISQALFALHWLNSAEK